MKYLKGLLALIVLLIALVLVAALFISKDFQFQRSVVINRPPEQVFSFLRQLKNQDQYSKWMMIDPAMKKTYRGLDGHPGFVYAWDSQQGDVGKGEQELNSLRENKEVQVELRFEKPFKNVMHMTLTTEGDEAGQTTTTMSVSGHNTYPTNVMNLFIPAMLSKDVDTSLYNLKAVLERP
jgi:uncharacterized protein YndB with AHSA1/START domain